MSEKKSLKLSGSEEIYKLRQMRKKEKGNNRAKHSRCQESSMRIFDEIPPAGYREGQPLSTSTPPAHRQRGWVWALSSFSLSFKSGNCARYSIATLHTGVWTKSAITLREGHVIHCWETPSAASRGGAPGRSLCIISVKKEKLTCLIQKGPLLSPLPLMLSSSQVHRTGRRGKSWQLWGTVFPASLPCSLEGRGEGHLPSPPTAKE